MTDDIDTLLRNHGVRPTANRVIVARHLMTQSAPRSMAEIEEAIDTIDRSSIFRVLSLFEQSGIAHAIDDGTGSVKYEICHGHTHSLADMHIHFHCERCGSTICFEEIPVPEIPLPQGYTANAANYIVKGICPKCAHKH